MLKKLKTIQVANTNLDIYDGSIGVSCSGGADSTILLYHLMKHAKGTIHIFTTGNNQRERYNVKVACEVVEKCIRLTGNTNIEHHISYCEVQSFDTLFPKLDFYLKSGIIDMLYTGITANPPKEVSDTFKLPVSEANRDGNSDLIHHNGKVYTPWYNINKQEIAKMYDEELLKDLFAITRSCEYDPTSSYFDNIENPQDGHCGECWWCEERKWAFGRL